MGLRGMYCKICKLPQEALTQIDNKLRIGIPQSVVARDYGVSRDSIGRHYRAGHHILLEPVVEEEKLPVKPGEASKEVAVQSGDVMSSIYRVTQQVEGILAEYKRINNARGVLEASKALKPFLELSAKIEGLIKEGQVNILINPQWVSIKAAIMRALDRHPELKDDVLSELRAVVSDVTIEGEEVEIID